MSSELEAIAGGDVCELAKDRHRAAAQWLGLWTALVYCVAIVLAAFIATALWSSFDLPRRQVAGLVSLSGTVAQGAALGWFVRRRKEIRSEERAAFEAVERLCGVSTEAESARSSMSFFGVT